MDADNYCGECDQGFASRQSKERHEEHFHENGDNDSDETESTDTNCTEESRGSDESEESEDSDESSDGDDEETETESEAELSPAMKRALLHTANKYGVPPLSQEGLLSQWIKHLSDTVDNAIDYGEELQEDPTYKKIATTAEGLVDHADLSELEAREHAWEMRKVLLKDLIESNAEIFDELNQSNNPVLSAMFQPMMSNYVPGI